MTNKPTSAPALDPLNQYTQRLAMRRAALAEEQQRSRKIWILRRIDFIAIFLALVLAVEGICSPWWIVLPVVVFIALMAIHQRIHQRRDRLEGSVKFYERGIARLEDRWAGSGETGERFADKSHLYAEDLDLFGKGSLFELLCTARTRAGEERLASWLLTPAPIPEIRARQEAVDELRSRLDLREDLAVLGADIEAGIHTDALLRWATAPPVIFSRFMPVAAASIGIFALAAVILWFGFGYKLLALGALMGVSLFLFHYRDRVSQVVAAVERPGRELALLAGILSRLEQERFSSPRLDHLRRRLETAGQPPSHQIAQLARLIQILDSMKNQFFAPLALILLLPAQLAYAIEKWRRSSGALIPAWLEAVSEIEALSALASYAFDHPGDQAPELVETEVGFAGEALGHPLIPESRCVRNDVWLGRDQQLLVISGSNMSGKSTLLRTIGINVVLALAGAPVRAKRLRLSPLAIGASIHILDSLQTGASRFYAEITRLRDIVELTNGRLPLLFLLDEILSGTNSHDRRIGAEAVVRELVERGAIGLVTTHDLALTQIAENLGARATNVHFEDHLENGEIKFDYQMRPGIVQRSNALELMRAVGLNVGAG
ncbi:MAG TPA: DNA mismatch repair protein MutS [Blastocatellia bacterium]|nr:DNA mismatch repair protein MutS [Blastocatellia bacterium]